MNRSGPQGLGRFHPFSQPSLSLVLGWDRRPVSEWCSPLCSYRPHSSPRQGTGLTHSSPGRSSECWGQTGKEKRRVGEAEHRLEQNLIHTQGHCSWTPRPVTHGTPSYRHNPLHGLQLEGIFIGVQHLFQVIMPGGRQRKSDEGWRWGMDHQAGLRPSPVQRDQSQGCRWRVVTYRLGFQEKHVRQPLLWVGLCSLAKRKDVEVLTP